MSKRFDPLWLGCGAFAGLVVLLLAYMFGIAPYRVELTTHRVGFNLGLRVFQISDLHSSGIGKREREVLKLIEETRPDLIVITGDSVANAPCDAVHATLRELHAPLGVWFVPGNWEHWMAREQGDQCLCPPYVNCLRNRAEPLLPGLWIAGVDDAMVGEADSARTISEVPPDAQLLLLAHEPTSFDELTRSALVFAGHTHGGQVCLPGIGALLLPPGSGPYESGWYERSPQHARMYVSRGVGTSLIPARLRCTPEVSLFEL